MIEAMVSPVFMIRAMRDGKESPGQAPISSETPQQEPGWFYERKGGNKLISYPGNDGPVSGSGEKQSGLVFQRSEIADRKFTEVRLPGP